MQHRIRECLPRLCHFSARRAVLLNHTLDDYTVPYLKRKEVHMLYLSYMHHKIGSYISTEGFEIPYSSLPKIKSTLVLFSCA